MIDLLNIKYQEFVKIYWMFLQNLDTMHTELLIDCDAKLSNNLNNRYLLLAVTITYHKKRFKS